MMVEAMTVLLKQLNGYVAQADGDGPGAPVQAVWGNVAQIERPEVATELENHIVLTLVNIEEERALRNGKTFVNVGSDPAYRNRPIHLNLFLLFTANYRNYGTALRRLSQVLTFFQGKQKFTLANSPGALPQPPIVEFSLTMDLLSPTLEGINHLWGFLGAKQGVSVLYRGRLVAISDDRTLAGGGYIREIDVLSRDATA